MTRPETPSFDPHAYLDTEGRGRHVLQIKAKQDLFSQGDPANWIFYLQRGNAKLTVLSKAGKEATITLLGPGDFTGEEAIAAPGGRRLAPATALTACTAQR